MQCTRGDADYNPGFHDGVACLGGYGVVMYRAVVTHRSPCTTPFKPEKGGGDIRFYGVRMPVLGLGLTRGGLFST